MPAFGSLKHHFLDRCLYNQVKSSEVLIMRWVQEPPRCVGGVGETELGEEEAATWVISNKTSPGQLLRRVSTTAASVLSNEFH